MRMTQKNATIAVVFLLLYYVYFNSVRKIMLPLSSVLVPVILILSVCVVLHQSNGKLSFWCKTDKTNCFVWILIAICLLMNNESLIHNFFSGGMIQLYTMIVFMLFAIRSDDWVEKWIKVTQFFVGIHAAATIIFYFNANLYRQFANFFFSGNVLSDLLRFYNKGWMSGLCTHFSSNGMVLAVGLILAFEQIRFKGKQNRPQTRRKKFGDLLFLLIVLYALILSSKRGPLLSAILAIAIVYIFAQGKNVGKRLLILAAVCIVVYLAYKMLLGAIPGLATIMNKMNALEETDAGLLNGRQTRWARAFEMIASSPIWGHGYGSYATYTASVGNQTSAHNYYLSVFAELGIIGLCLYVTAFATGVLSAHKALKCFIKKQETDKVYWISVCMEIQLFVVFYSMTATSMMYYYVLIPYFLACAAPRAIIFVNKKNEVKS